MRIRSGQAETRFEAGRLPASSAIRTFLDATSTCDPKHGARQRKTSRHDMLEVLSRQGTL